MFVIIKLPLHLMFKTYMTSLVNKALNNNNFREKNILLII